MIVCSRSVSTSPIARAGFAFVAALLVALAAVPASAQGEAPAGGALYFGAWRGAGLYVEVAFEPERRSAELRLRSASRAGTAGAELELDATGCAVWSGERVRIEARGVVDGAGYELVLEAPTLPRTRTLDPFAAVGTAMVALRPADPPADGAAGDPEVESAAEVELRAIGTRYRDAATLADGSFGVRHAAPLFYAEPWRDLDLVGWARSSAAAALADGLQQRRDVPRGVAGTWTWERAVHVTTLGETVASAEIRSYAYTGGAHPNSWVETVTWVRGERGWREVDLCGALAALELPCDAAAVRARVIAELHDRDAAWVVAGEVSTLTPWLLEPFTLTPGGVRFEYSPYDVGPYVQGFFTVFVPFADLAGGP